MKHYQAPWSLSLVVVTLLVSVICLTITAFHWANLVAMRFGTLGFWQALVPLVIILGAALFTIRGYSLTGDTILVHRLFWATRLPRAGLQSVRVEPDALQDATRTCGNGGLFSASGWYRSPSLGSFRAFVTDSARAVVLRYSDRTFVVSPANPEGFVHDLAVTERSVRPSVALNSFQVSRP